MTLNLKDYQNSLSGIDLVDRLDITSFITFFNYFVGITQNIYLFKLIFRSIRTIKDQYNYDIFKYTGNVDCWLMMHTFNNLRQKKHQSYSKESNILSSLP